MSKTYLTVPIGGILKTDKPVHIALEIPSKFGIEYFVWVWLANAKSDVVKHVTGTGDKASIVDVEGTGIEIHINDSGPLYLEAYRDPDAIHAPVISLLVFSRTRTRSDEGDKLSGWMHLGASILGPNQQETELTNYHFALELGLNNRFPSDSAVGTVSYNKFQLDNPAGLPYKIPMHAALHVDYATNQRRICQQLTRFLNSDLYSILNETMIGRNTGVVPRTFFYTNTSRHMKLDEDWLYCVLRFGEWFFCGGKKLPDNINDAMSIVSMSVTLFVSRFEYQPDAVMINETPAPFECFSQTAFSLGLGDCEDVSWVLMAIFSYLKNRTIRDRTNPRLLDRVTMLLENFIPTSCLLQAKQPEFSPTSVASVISAEIIQPILVPLLGFTEEDLRKSQGSMEYYHMVTILMPAGFMREKRGGLEMTKDERKIRPIMAEGTSSTYGDILRTDVIPLKERDEMNRTCCSMLEKGYEPGEVFTHLTMENGCKMYGSLIELFTDTFASTGQYIFLAGSKFKEEGDPDMGFIPEEITRCPEKVRIIPLDPDITKMINAEDFQLMEEYEPPAPILQIDRKKFELELTGLQPPKMDPERPERLLWHFYYSRSNEKKEDESAVIPLLSWNMTDKTETQSVSPWYLHIELDYTP